MIYAKGGIIWKKIIFINNLHLFLLANSHKSVALTVGPISELTVTFATIVVCNSYIKTK